MINNNHPITPPVELVEAWFLGQRGLFEASRLQIATQAARWGYEQAIKELEAFYVFQYTHFNGTRETWWCPGCTPDEARATAEHGGWLPPRWWQWWRRKDRCGVLLENYFALSSGNN